MSGERPDPGSGPVESALRRDLADLAKRDGDLAKSALAETALTLARELDEPENSATSKSMCARALQDALERLRELAPAKREADRLDDLASRRARRRGGSHDTADQART